jgi:hypothetical protein
MGEAFSGYRNDTDIPIGAYATLLGTFTVSVAGFAWVMRRRLRPPRLFELLVMGVATHEITQVLSHAWVTAPLRAPFTRNQGKASDSGDPEEEARGNGLRRAIGELVTCPMCLAPWVSAGLVAGSIVAPLPASFVTSIFAVAAVSNYLARARAVAAGKARVVSSEAKIVKRAAERADA